MLMAALAVLLVGVWSLTGPDARGSDVLVVIEDASEEPTGLFPGTVCYSLVRQYDEAVISQGCLAIAVSILAPAGFNRTAMYTLDVSMNHPDCRVLEDARFGSGVVPFRIRVSCHDLQGGKSGDSGATAGEQRDIPFVAASASPIVIPVTGP